VFLQGPHGNRIVDKLSDELNETYKMSKISRKYLSAQEEVDGAADEASSTDLATVTTNGSSALETLAKTRSVVPESGIK